MKLSRLSTCVGLVCVLMAPVSYSLADDHRVKGTHGPYKASELIGKSVENLQGDNLGKIEELAIGSTGKVEYAVLSYGGILGMGDKLFAVPFTSLAHSQDGDNLTMDIPQKKLENAPGFNKNEWPDMTDEKWKSGISEFYRSTGRRS